MANVFISYSSKSKVIAEVFERFFRDECHFYVWVDYDSIKGGDAWEQQIYDGLSRCDTLIVLVDEYSVSSEWVKKEIYLARQRGMEIFPALVASLENVPIALETLGIGDIQGINFDTQSSPYETLKDQINKKSRNNYEFHRLIRQIIIENNTLSSQQLIDELADLQDKRATPYLLKILQQDSEDYPVHWSAIDAIDALGRLKDDRAIPILKSILRKKIEKQALYQGNNKSACVEALGNIGGIEARNLIFEALYIDGVSYHAIEALLNFKDEKTLNELSKLLNLSDRKLGNLFSSYHDKQLGITYKENATRLRLKILETMTVIYQGLLNPPLLKLLKKHKKLDKEVLGNILDLLNRDTIENPQSINLLKEIIVSDYPHSIRGAAVKALGGAPTEKILDFLIELLNDATIIPYVVTTFERLGDQRAVPHLKNCLNKLETDDQFIVSIPQLTLHAYYRSSFTAIYHALYTLGHKEYEKDIYRSYLYS